MKNKKHLYRLIYKTLPALLIIFTIYTAAAPEKTFAYVESAPALEVETTAQDDFDKKFREGRDLIDKEEWARAAEKFREAIDKYPNGKSADAALYWLAFCHKKQNQFKEAAAALDRLMEKFPASSWADDARVMKMEISLPRAGTYSAAAVAGGFQTSAAAPGTFSPAAAAVGLNQIYNGALLNTAPTYARASELVAILNEAPAGAKLDREDEIKIAAFQSLLSADPKRAIETMGEMLKPNSKASETLKQEVIRVLRAPRWSGTHIVGLASGGGNIERGASKEFAPLVRDALIKGWQNDLSVKLRKEIIYSLAHLADEQSIEFLKKRYADENDREIKKAIIGAFSSSSSNMFYAVGAGNLSFGGTNNSSRTQTRKTEFNFLLEIVRTEKDAELRRLAFTNLQRFPNWAADAQMMAMVSNLYDAETDEAFKIFIIRSLAANQNQTTGKLLDIARREKSDKLKLEAIYALRNSKDPEVLRFLEELIK